MNVKIGPINYAVRFDPDAVGQTVVNVGKTFYGHIDYRSASITINPAYHADQQRLALAHEVLHALIDTANLDGEGEPLHETEEKVVTRLAPHFAQFIQDDKNAEALAFIQGKEVPSAAT